MKGILCKENLCGVPQDSVLIPILFLLYFFHDTGYLKSSNNLETLFQTTNHELSKASCWFQTNMLTLNVSKTKYIAFINKSKPFEDQGFNLKIGNEIIERKCSTYKYEYFKFVSVEFDEYLNWNYQIDGIFAKLSSAIFALKSVSLNI